MIEGRFEPDFNAVLVVEMPTRALVLGNLFSQYKGGLTYGAYVWRFASNWPDEVFAGFFGYLRVSIVA